MAAERPRPSIHAENRWVQYADPDADIELAWDGALPLVDHGFHADEARYCPEHDVVLLRKDTEITTVVNNDDGIRYQAKEAIAKAVAIYGDEPISR